MTVRQLLRAMTAREFARWVAFYRHERFSEWRADFRIAQLCALFANANRDASKKPEPFDIADFMPFLNRQEQSVQVDGDGGMIAPETLTFLFAKAKRG